MVEGAEGKVTISPLITTCYLTLLTSLRRDHLDMTVHGTMSWRSVLVKLLKPKLVVVNRMV
jgi:hypothetical protein